MAPGIQLTLATAWGRLSLSGSVPSSSAATSRLIGPGSSVFLTAGSPGFRLPWQLLLCAWPSRNAQRQLSRAPD